MSYCEIAAMTYDDRFRSRIRQAVITAAKRVYNEDPETAAHASRAELALRILQAPDAAMMPFAAICADAIYTAWQSSVPEIMEPTDEMLDSEIEAVWNAVAGAV